MARNNLSAIIGLKSAIFRSPAVLLETLPLIIMLGSLITFISLSKSSELIILRASGRSALKILLVPIMITFCIGVLATMVANPLVAVSIKASENFLDEIGLKSRSFLSVSEDGIWLREIMPDKQAVIKADRTNSTGNLLFNVTLFEFDGEDNLRRRIIAKKGTLKSGQWILEDASIWMPKSTSPINQAFFFTEVEKLYLKTELTQSQILDSFADPKAINFWFLSSFINKLELSGFSALRHKLFLQTELARPFFLVAMFLIGAIFSLRQAKFSQTSILVLLSVSSGFLLFTIKRITESFGGVQEIPIVLAAFGPSISGILLCVGFLLHFEDG